MQVAERSGGEEGLKSPSAGPRGWDPYKKKWVQTWVDNSGAYITLAGGPVTGKPWSFELLTVEPRGPKQVHSRMIWQDVKPDSFTWRWQARQADGSYADSWVIEYKRRK